MKYKVPVIPGDGIGPEIVVEGQKVLEAAADKYNFSLDWIDFTLGAEHYLKSGELVSEETLKELSAYPAIFLGAIGDPRVKPGILEKGVLLTMRSTSISMSTCAPSSSWRASGPRSRIRHLRT